MDSTVRVLSPDGLRCCFETIMAYQHVDGAV